MGEKGILPSVDREVSTDDMMENRSYSNRRGAEKRWPREIERTESVATEKVARSRKSTLIVVEKTASLDMSMSGDRHHRGFAEKANKALTEEGASVRGVDSTTIEKMASSNTNIHNRKSIYLWWSSHAS